MIKFFKKISTISVLLILCACSFTKCSQKEEEQEKKDPDCELRSHQGFISDEVYDKV